MSEPAASGIAQAARAAVSASRPNGSQKDKPPEPSANKQQSAATVLQLTGLTHNLKLANGRIDAQQHTIAELQGRDEENRQALSLLSLRIDSLEKNNEVLRATLEMVTKSLGIDLSNLVRTSDLAGTSAPSHTGDLTSEEEEKVTKIIKAAFLKLYGITKFNPRDHGIYPSVSKEHMDWPHRHEGDRRVVFDRFNFSKECSYSSPINNASFQAWIDLSIKQGPILIGHNEIPTRVLNRDTVSKQCIQQFKYLQRRVREISKDLAPVVGVKRRGEGLDEPVVGESYNMEATNLVDVSAGSNEGGMAINPTLLSFPVDHPESALPGMEVKEVKPTVGKRDKNSKENMRSRSQGKLSIRVRKRQELSTANAVYQQKKYDGFFTIGGTSDDEMVEVTNERGDIVEEFHARPWAFASDEHVKCQEAVDATNDPQPASRQAIRKRGTNMVDSPSVSKTIKTGVLSWMVKPDILKKNPQWLTQNRVYPSGAEWGEEEPKDRVPKSKAPKRVKIEDMASNLDQIQRAQEEWQAAQQKVEESQNAILTEGELINGPALV